MRRTLAVTISCLSVLPLLMIGSPAGPHGASRYIAGAVGVFGLAMAWWWWFRQWPSRVQSWTIVAAGTAGITLACLTFTDPVVGLLGTPAFALVTSYAAFLHGRRILVLTWLACGVAVAFLGVRAAMVDVWLGVSGVLVSILIIVVTSSICRLAVGLVDPVTARHPAEIDQLTGLLNRHAFDMHTATMLGSHSRHDDEFLVIVAIGIDDMGLLSDMDGTHSTLHARVAVGQALRETVRHGVRLAHVSDSEYLIADVFKTNDPSPLVHRIRIAISTTPMRLTASIGTACSPLRPLTELPTEQVVNGLVDLAVRAMNQSRAAGGNQTTYAHYPTPTMGPDQD